MIFNDGSALAELAAQDAESQEYAQADRARLREGIREAFRAGLTKTEIHRETGISRPTIDAWTRGVRKA